MAALSGFAHVINLDVTVTPGVSTDVEKFVSTNVQELSEQVSMGEASLERVKDMLMERSEGTFLWIGFAMAVLRQAQTEYEIVSMIHSLDQLPAGLTPMYERILSSIDVAHKEIMIRILRWVAISVEPLELKTLGFVVHCEPKGTMSMVDTMKDYIKLCGLLLIDSSLGELVHESVRDYLMRTGVDQNHHMEEFRVKSEDAHFEAAQSCLHAISGDNRLKSLRPYATMHWLHHAERTGSRSNDLFRQEFNFFKRSSDVRDTWWLNLHPTNARSLDAHQWTQLRMACFMGSLWWARLIIENGVCHVDDISPYGISDDSIKIAIMRDSPAMVEFLTNHGASNQAKKGPAQRPALILFAVRQGRMGIMRILLEQGMDPNITDEEGNTVLHLAAFGKLDASFVKLLLLQKVDVNAKNAAGDTALHVALRGNANEKLTVPRMLLIGGANPNEFDSTGLTPLHRWARVERNDTIAQLLLQHGAIVDVCDATQSTALHHAVTASKHSNAEFLLSRGACANAKDEHGASPFLLAAGLSVGGEEMMELLLNSGADFSTRNHQNSTPLHRAVWHGVEATTRLLLKRMADVSAENKDGWTALHVAALKGHAPMVEMLIKANANVRAKERDDMTALHLAAHGGHDDAVNALINSGADVLAEGKISTYLGRIKLTPLDCAVWKGYKGTERILRKHGSPRSSLRLRLYCAFVDHTQAVYVDPRETGRRRMDLIRG